MAEKIQPMPILTVLIVYVIETGLSDVEKYCVLPALAVTIIFTELPAPYILLPFEAFTVLTS